MSYPRDPQAAPNWSFSPEHEILCPLCQVRADGIDWVLDEAGENTVGMTVIACGCYLPASEWILSFTGRERRLRQVIRTPIFERKATP